MENKKFQELEDFPLDEFSLEDIIREFSDHPTSGQDEDTAVEAETEVKEETPAAEETVEAIAEEEPAEDISKEEEPAEQEAVEEETAPEISAEEAKPDEVITQEALMSGDTIRLDSSELLKGVVHDAQHIDDEEEEAPLPPQEEKPDFSGEWEPEYEQPMGEYIPPQPIAFPTRAESREMKRKLVVGPEKKFYELTEKGLGKLQLSMFFVLLVVVGSAISTVAYAQGMIPENRLRLMIFSQCLAVLVSALFGSFQLIQGAADLIKGRFTLNTLLLVTFFACCADGVFCLMQLRVPCCAAFSLEVLMSLWSTYNRRHAALGQMDVLRKAARLQGVCAKDDAYEGKKVLQRIPGKVEHFMDNYDQATAPEKRQGVYALIALILSIGVGVYAAVTRDLYVGIQMTVISLLAALPATAFIATTRPFAILQRRLHRLGAVLCGWQGVKQLCGKAIFPLYNDDIFPLGTTRMNGVKFFGNRPTDLVMSYAAAVIMADGGSLAPIFRQVLESRNGNLYDAQNLRRYENGGIGGNVLDEPVLVGSLSFLKDMGVEVPEGIQVSQAVCVAIDGELCGVFAISYEKTRSATAGLSTLSSYRGLNPVMADGQFMMSESFIRSKFGIKSKRLQFPGTETRMLINSVQPEETAEAALLTTKAGLAPMAYCVTGARALRNACNVGVVLHMIGGILGLGIVVTLLILDATHLLIPANMFLYQLAWMIPGWIVTEWTRSV